ncbi:MAG: glycosyltransferase family 9 protein [Isosphaeraceae bacterium]|nr:glycosyltransferase family 9 protein [Isosphaeraceae bacterium]
MESIVVFCPNLIGDTVMATPTIRALREGYPRARLIAVLKPGVAATLDGSPWFDDRIPFDPRSTDRSRRTPAVIRALREIRPDISILLPNSFRSALLARLGGSRRVVGYARGGRGFLLTDRLVAPRDRSGRFEPVPIVGYYAELARAAGCRVESLRTELFTTEADELAADRAFRALGLSDVGRVVCFNNGGAFGPAKSWPVESFVQLGRALVERFDLGVLMLCGPSEREAAREFTALANHPRIVSLADQPMSIGLSKASVRRSALMVTTDSGPRHFAAAFDVPVVSLFGPTHIAWTRTYHPLAIHLSQPVPCGPCQEPVCPEGHLRCMRELSPEAVLRACLRLLLDHGPRPHVMRKHVAHSEPN